MIDRACISLNSCCNFKCKYCHFGSRVKLSNINDNAIKKDEIECITENLILYVKEKNIPIFKLGIVGAGEPLLNFEDIKTVVETIEKQGILKNFQIYTITNGSLINNEIIDFAFTYKNIFTLSFSLDGYKEINNKYRESFDNVWQNIKLYQKKFGQMPQINATITSESYKNQYKLFEFFLTEKITRINFSKVFGDVDEKMIISDEQYEEFLINAEKSGIEFRQATKKPKYDCAKYGRLCGVGRTNIYITKQGIFPCARFWKNPTFFLGESTASLFNIEEKLKSFTPCPDYRCYYEYYSGEKV